MLDRLSASQRARLTRFQGKQIGVVGLGREGIDLSRFLAAVGAQVVASDAAPAEALGPALAALEGIPIRLLLGDQHGEDLLGSAEIFVSPGVPRSVPVVAEPARAGVPISSATRLFLELCPGPVLGVTGSSGKTTTTTLVGDILRTSGLPTFVGGNMGAPTLMHLEELTPDTWSVLELSSFQLEDVTQSPTIGVILNITPNHLDRHPDMDDYIRAKGNLIRFQTGDDSAVLNADDPTARQLVHASRTVAFSLTGQVNGTWLDGEDLMMGGRLWTAAAHHLSELPATQLMARQEVPLRGLHNVANVLAAAAAALCVGCHPQAIVRAIRSFRPVPHRLEVVGMVGGVTFVNDSIATSPERSIAALNSFEEPIVLVAGGRDKHLPMDDWARLIQQRTRGVVLVGEAAPLIDAALRRTGSAVPVATATDFEEVLPLARGFARAGDVVLLSPGCTSFDQFRDYEARGAAFREAVRALMNQDEAQGGSKGDPC